MHTDWQAFLQEQGATMEENGAIDFSPVELDITCTPVTCALSGFTLLSIGGDDRHDFLHGQLINDLNLIDNPAAQISGWCNPKGQLISTFLVINTGTSHLLLFKQDLAEYIQKRLGMFIMRANVTVTDITDKTPLIGLANIKDLSITGIDISGSPGGVMASEGLIIVNLPDQSGRQLILGNIETQKNTFSALQGSLTTVGSTTWELLDILAGLPWITAATQEQFLPQMLNLDLLKGLSYKKGCYPGQEVVARLHFRGEVKKRLHLLDCDTSINTGDKVTTADGENAGTIINSSRYPDGHYVALAVITQDKAGASLVVDKQPISLSNLPYASTI